MHPPSIRPAAGAGVQPEGRAEGAASWAKAEKVAAEALQEPPGQEALQEPPEQVAPGERAPEAHQALADGAAAVQAVNQVVREA